MFMFEHYIHEVISTPNGMVLIDVANTPDCGWEGAYARFNKEVFEKAWFCEEDAEPYDMKDIIEWGEEFDAFNDWEIVSSHRRNPEVALRNVMKALKKAG